MIMVNEMSIGRKLQMSVLPLTVVHYTAKNACISITLKVLESYWNGQISIWKVHKHIENWPFQYF